MKIAIQGELGSFSHQAALNMAPHPIIVPCQRSAQVFTQLEQNKVNAIIVPIENTLAGSVAEHYDLLLNHDVSIIKEFNLRIVHTLITNAKAKMKDIRKIYSHPIALDQCRKFLKKFPRIQIIPYYDTAGAVRHIIQEELRDCAAIASELAAKTYGGQIIKHSIEDNKKNYTRFFLLKKKHTVTRNTNKVSLGFALKNKPGALFKALSVFALRDINLCKIESRPVPGKPWEYIFFIDLLHKNDAALKQALQQLAEVTEFFKILGFYTAAKH